MVWAARFTTCSIRCCTYFRAPAATACSTRCISHAGGRSGPRHLHEISTDSPADCRRADEFGADRISFVWLCGARHLDDGREFPGLYRRGMALEPQRGKRCSVLRLDAGELGFLLSPDSGSATAEAQNFALMRRRGRLRAARPAFLSLRDLPQFLSASCFASAGSGGP